MMSERKLWDDIRIYREKSIDDRLKGTFLTSDNIARCMELFGHIIEHLGIFKEIMNELKVDLVESIFSHHLTADEKSEGSIVERMPFFMLYLQSEERLKITSHSFQDIIQNLQQRIQDQLKDLNDAHLDNALKENEFKELQDEISRYKCIENEKNVEVESIIDSMNKLERELGGTIQQMAIDNELLKLKLLKHEDKIKELQFYKDSHDHTDQTFSNACENFKENSNNPNVDPFNKKNNLETEIKAIVVMQQDLITLENHLLEDFDRRLMNFKKVMLDCEDTSKSHDFDEQQSFENLAKMMMEFNKSKIHFKNECVQLELESLMLDNHQIVLVNELTTIHQAELDINQNCVNDHKEIRESFIIDEKLLSKYSAIIYISSNGGHTYYETKETIFCESCGGKVVFCPHNITRNKVIKLPIGSTHIKIQRPEIKINSKFAKYMAPTSQYLKEEKLETSKSNDERKTVSSRKSQRSSIASSESDVALPFEVLLEDFENRTKITRMSPRIFEEDKILSIFEDFWATILIEDEFDVQLSETSTIYDKVYIFFMDRYANERAAMLSLYDFIISIIDAADYSQLLQLFCHILLVNIDSSVMRYVFHLLDCVDIVTWSGEEDLRLFIETVYSFLDEDEVDSLVLSYISYSEHVYNKVKVVEFILYNILKQRDPRFTLIKGQTSEFKTNITGYCSFKEYQILLESLTSLPNRKLSIRLFKELALLYSDESDKDIAPISKITHIISFLSFLEIVDNVKQNLHEKYESSPTLKVVHPHRWGYTRLKALSRQLQKEE